MFEENQLVVPLSQSLVNYINQQSAPLRMKPFRTGFFIKNERIHYKVTTPTDEIENPLDFKQLPLDLKALGGADTNNLVYFKQIVKLFANSLKLVIEDYFLWHVNAEARDVIADPDVSKIRIALKPDCTALTFTCTINDAISRAAFDNLLIVASQPTFRLAPDRPFEQVIMDHAPIYQLSLIIELRG